VTGRQGRRRRKLLIDIKERRGYSHPKEEALDRTMWKQIIEGKIKGGIEVTGRRGRRRRKLLDGLNPLKHRILRKNKSLEARIFVLVVI
jgi:hypothetical protein